MKTAYVIGAGLSGATAARQLAEAGHAVEVFEAKPIVAGNLAESYFEAKRFHLHGPHFFSH